MAPDVHTERGWDGTGGVPVLLAVGGAGAGELMCVFVGVMCSALVNMTSGVEVLCQWVWIGRGPQVVGGRYKGWQCESLEVGKGEGSGSSGQTRRRRGARDASASAVHGPVQLQCSLWRSWRGCTPVYAFRPQWDLYMVDHREAVLAACSSESARQSGGGLSVFTAVAVRNACSRWMTGPAQRPR